ncbi:MAG TPA: oxygenase MpaB family protein [Marmoricola sp.]|nr:oxygenase MpaB family protein [Marmoricola sp.]
MLRTSSTGRREPRPGRAYWTRRIARLDPHEDHEEIYRILVAHEFPWDLNQSLSFALFRTYAVPSIGRLLFETGELTERTQKRYDDTVLLLDEVLTHGLRSTAGRAAVRRVNQMHAMYDISNDDMRYVLATFVVVPARWLDDYGWRPLTPAERVASTEHYRALGRHLGIKGIPGSYEELERLLDGYEAAHFAYDEGARQVADATLELMTTFPPNDLAPAWAVRRFSYAVMDDPLLDAFGYPRPTAVVRRAARLALRSRAAALRLAPPRLEPLRSGDLKSIRSYPSGYRTEELGTFAPGCPGASGRGPVR